MAKSPTDTVRVAFELEFNYKDYQNLLGCGAAPQGTPELAIIGGVAKRLLEDQARGGLMIRPNEMVKIVQSTGCDPETGEDLIPYIAETTKRQDGKRVVKVYIDPAFEQAYEEVASFQGKSIDEVYSDVVQMVMEQQVYFNLPTPPRHVLMPEHACEELEELLGGKFSNGTELATLVRRSLGAEVVFAGDSEDADI